ncbi:MAG: hypothetical protein LC674_06030, partial [Actinobacteria bacterium]|nr:hypothetical protein [Actinomycetota bacterium]
VDYGSSGSKHAAVGRPYPVADLKRVARKVEKIRGLRFKKLPEVRIIKEPEMDRAASEGEDDGSMESDDELGGVGAEIDLLKLSGNVPNDFALASIQSVLEGDVAGFELPHGDRIYLLEDDLDVFGFGQDATLAHELIHALEDQNFDLRYEEKLSTTSQKGIAVEAFREGVATLGMLRYIERDVGVPIPLPEFLTGIKLEAEDLDLPPIFRASETFPYFSGTLFADQLYRRAGGWKLINRALRHPPVSDEQILHPERWLQEDSPVTVTLNTKGLGDQGWVKEGGSELGEFDSALLFGDSGASAGKATEDWEGGRFELWRRRGYGGCHPPCRKTKLAVIGWAWETPQDASEFASLVMRYLESRPLRAPTVGSGAWQIADGVAALAIKGRNVALAFAPTIDLAETLVGS